MYAQALVREYVAEANALEAPGGKLVPPGCAVMLRRNYENFVHVTR
jgi:hypothetical protein